LGKGVFLSTYNDTSWTAVSTGLTDMNIFCLAVSGKNIFAGTWLGGVFLSTNNGTNWTSVNTGLPNTPVYALRVISENLFAGTSSGTSSGSVWKRPLSEMITFTSVKQVSAQLPERFALYQNYPNPFNPSTSISFSLQTKSYVSLKVFDALGREVSILVSEELTAGTYTKQWNASGLSSGVYFYRIQTGLFTETKKILLLR
jgi:hypothetical protein